MQPSAPAILAQGLTKRFKNLAAVNGVDLRLEAGAALALLGPNGAGKTTLVEMLEGLQKPDAGSIRLFGRAWSEPGASTLRGQLGVCLQDSKLPEKLSAAEILILFASFHGLPRARAEAVLDQVGLRDKAQTWSQHLSGGQRQRLALGVAMLPSPRLLLLDEPTTGLDPAARREVWGLVDALKRGGCALLLTTHYMEEAEALCPEVALMHQGRLLARGPVKQLLAAHGGGDRLEARFNRRAPATLLKSVPGLLEQAYSEGGRRVRLRVKALGPALQGFCRAAAAAKLELRSLSTHKASLEDLFLALAGGRLDDDGSEVEHA